MFMLRSRYYLFLGSFWLTDANFELHAISVKRFYWEKRMGVRR